MTHRERHTPDDAPPRDPTRTPPVARSASTAAAGKETPPPGVASLWEDWYQRASPVQQQEALQQAVQQGLLFTHQLPAPVQASAPHRSLLGSLLNGQVKELEPLRSPSLECHDRDLDRTQREAVARAVATPDVCLIQGFPGTGKSRVLVEIILQAAKRGERILLLAANPAALDRVLERLSSHPAVCPIRCLTPDETVAALRPAIARLTMAERLRAYRETTVPAARALRDSARRAAEARRAEQSRWKRLEELAEQGEHNAQRLCALREARAKIASEVERGENTSLDFRESRKKAERARVEARERVDSQLAGLQAELDTILGKQNHLQSEWEQIRPLAEARQTRRFWTGSWWRAVLRSGLSEQVRDLEARRSELRTSQERLERDIATLEQERAEIEGQCAAQCRRLQDLEIARRQTDVDAEIAVVVREQAALDEQWRSLCKPLPAGEAPAEINRQAVAAGRANWEIRREQSEKQAVCAEEWLQTVEDGMQSLPDKLAHCANLVAATTTALSRDPHVGDRAGTPALMFDLLILDEAHQVTESEFAAAARRARRWVLLGEPQHEVEHPATPRKILRPSVLRTGVFERLWHNLHADPHRLPFSWRQSDGRLVCRLRPFTREQEKWIETEPVVDRPEIELRILSVPRQVPQVVEVLFPSCIGLSEAKQFIYRELEELAVKTRGRSLSWSETSEEVILELAPAGEGETVSVPLGSDVVEQLARLPDTADTEQKGDLAWHTCALRFPRCAGWTLERAEAWIGERLGLRSLGRTVLLTVPYRLDPPLARFLSDLLFGGLCQPGRTEGRLPFSRPPVEFVAVPALASLENRPRPEPERRWNDPEAGYAHAARGQAALSVRPPRMRALKGGAGLELELADNRPLEQLPEELRSCLPRQGLVNYLEARAVVTYLETLVQNESFRLACEHWRHRHLWPCEHGCASPVVCGCPQTDNGPAVTVMALYPAQVALLRHLIGQSPTLASAPIPLEVGPPSAFYQRECLLALVSLTRSHTHRAVSYGEHPHALAQALTRAAAGLVLFGDPGTLARRSQWQGPLDHLDESAAQREGSLVSQLVQYLQGHGPHPSVFHLREGSSV